MKKTAIEVYLYKMPEGEEPSKGGCRYTVSDECRNNALDSANAVLLTEIPDKAEYAEMDKLLSGDVVCLESGNWVKIV